MPASVQKIGLHPPDSSPARTVLVRYAEITLKGKNRPYFESKLLENMKRALGANKFHHERAGASYMLHFEDPPGEAVMAALSGVFGIANFALMHESPLDMDALTAAVLERLPMDGVKNFAVRTRRSNRCFPYNSQEINCALGTAIQERHKTAVNLSHPELTLNVEVMKHAIYYYWEREEGPRGLPVGVSGKVTVLLSGGIDSPVAAYLMARRGCLPIYVHFHSVPFTNKASIEKTDEIVRVLERYHYSSRLYLIPLAEIQKAIVTSCPEPIRVILYRRFMVRLADAVARSERSQALVTGECVGQVASQTLSNIRTIEAVTKLPILRPLVSFDKDEIVRWARKIGTYEISIGPDQDCCSYLMPLKPATSSRVEAVVASEQALDIDGLLHDALLRTERRTKDKVTSPFINRRAN